MAIIFITGIALIAKHIASAKQIVNAHVRNMEVFTILVPTVLWESAHISPSSAGSAGMMVGAAS
jgi:hypothetical protein